MKRTILHKTVFAVICLLLLFTFSSCEEDEATPSLSSLIEGEWEVTTLELKNANVDFTGNGADIEFETKDDVSGKFKLKVGTYTASGDYELEQKGGDYELKLEFDNEIKWNFTIDGDGYYTFTNEIVFEDVTFGDSEIELEDGEDDNGYEWEWVLEVD